MKPPRVLVAPTAFKGCLSPLAAARAIARGLDDAVVQILPIADGGDGTREALTCNRPYETRFAPVRGPRGRPVRAPFALSGRRAIIEMADASGLKLLAPRERNPLQADTRGTGELIRAALDAGAREVLVGAGGSATVDGGAGALVALGARLLDRSGRPLDPAPHCFPRAALLDLLHLDPRLRTARILVLADVRQRLLGPTGAALLFARQKGARPDDLRFLAHALARWRHLVRHATGVDLQSIAGGGAAGGLAAGLAAVAGARVLPGARFILRHLRFEHTARRADFAILAEGRFDSTTRCGKAVGEAAAILRRLAIPFAILCGSYDGHTRCTGARLIVPIRPLARSDHDAIARAPRLLRFATAQHIAPILR
jgi:glycerate kinase